MKPVHAIAAALAAFSLYALAAESTGKLTAPWALAGKSPKLFEAGIDYRVTVSGTGSKFLRCEQCDEKSWATVMQQISAQRYLGQRIRFQAQVRTRDVGGWAGLWMRIDTPDRKNAVLYNSTDKPIRGTTEWQLRTVTLDVPPDASMISFGVIGEGKGQVWMDDLKFDTVGRDVPVDHLPTPTARIADRPSL